MAGHWAGLLQVLRYQHGDGREVTLSPGLALVGGNGERLQCPLRSQSDAQSHYAHDNHKEYKFPSMHRPSSSQGRSPSISGRPWLLGHPRYSGEPAYAQYSGRQKDLAKERAMPLEAPSHK